MGTRVYPKYKQDGGLGVSLGHPIFTVALPMPTTFVVATWTSIRQQNKRVDEVSQGSMPTSTTWTTGWTR